MIGIENTPVVFLVGAVLVATIASAVVLLRHRRPRGFDDSVARFAGRMEALSPDQDLDASVVRSVPRDDPAERLSSRSDGTVKPISREEAEERLRDSGEVAPLFPMGPAHAPTDADNSENGDR
ncbi:MAG TPA: hypothetical protein DEG43_03490 [Acidimicrobiaceae bacterium]|jgi:uncharacterized iron-regulated membrane protein|nr:hypothetical protein [Acidimicrobiaceae bacterium]